MPLSHPALWPIYEEAARQDLPVAVHVGNGSSPAILRMIEGVPRQCLLFFAYAVLPVLLLVTGLRLSQGRTAR